MGAHSELQLALQLDPAAVAVGTPPLPCPQPELR